MQNNNTLMLNCLPLCNIYTSLMNKIRVIQESWGLG